MQWVEVKSSCLICWYWWNSWQSLFKLSFLNISYDVNNCHITISEHLFDTIIYCFKYFIFKDSLLNCLYIIWPVGFVVNNVYRICIAVRLIIYVWPIWVTWRCLVRGRNYLPFTSTCIHPRFLVVSVLPIFLVFCFVWLLLFFVLCRLFAQKLPMSLDYQFLICPSAFSGVYLYDDLGYELFLKNYIIHSTMFESKWLNVCLYICSEL